MYNKISHWKRKEIVFLYSSSWLLPVHGPINLSSWVIPFQRPPHPPAPWSLWIPSSLFFSLRISFYLWNQNSFLSFCLIIPLKPSSNHLAGNMRLFTITLPCYFGLFSPTPLQSSQRLALCCCLQSYPRSHPHFASFELLVFKDQPLSLSLWSYLILPPPRDVLILRLFQPFFQQFLLHTYCVHANKSYSSRTVKMLSSRTRLPGCES